MYRRAAAFVLVLLASPLATPQSPPELFQQGKALFAEGDYRRSLEIFSKLDEMSRKPEHQRERAQLAPVIAFYRGANLAALGRADEATKEFSAYLALVPNATMNPNAFPREVVRAFEKARNREVNRTPSGDIESLWGAFLSVARGSFTTDGVWIETSVRYLLTEHEKNEWSLLESAEERYEFIEAFWKRRDPSPDARVNEYRGLFEARLHFADQYFGTAKKRGSMTDKGLIFTFFGPPNFVTVAQAGHDDDAIEVLRGSTQGQNLGRGHQSSGAGRPLEPASRKGTKETWVYRIGRIPPGVASHELEFLFVSKESHDEQVLQRDPEILLAIDQAVRFAESRKTLQ